MKFDEKKAKLNQSSGIVSFVNNFFKTKTCQK